MSAKVSQANKNKTEQHKTSDIQTPTFSVLSEQQSIILSKFAQHSPALLVCVVAL